MDSVCNLTANAPNADWLQAHVQCHCIAWHGLHILPINHVTPIQQLATLQTLVDALHSGWMAVFPFKSGGDFTT